VSRPITRVALLASTGLLGIAALTAAVGSSVAAGGNVPDDTDQSAIPSSTTSTVPPPAPGERVEYEMSPLAAAGDAAGTVIMIPNGCASPMATEAVFEADAEIVADEAVRFRVIRVLDGSIAGRAVGDRIDVDYGLDARFLVVGERYLVGAAADASTGRYASKVRPPKPMFGGDAVIGVDDTELRCPIVDDPIVTLTAAGTAVESGVLQPLQGSESRMLRAVARPVLIAILVLVVLVLCKHMVWATARSIRDAGEGSPVTRGTRSHRSPD
jgi:hypothetical protein